MKKNIFMNVTLLYIVLLFTIINIGTFLFYNDYQSILIFILSCVVIYFINKNMIFILGFSILFVDTLCFLRTREGFNENEYKNKKSFDSDEDELEPFNHDSDSDSESEYVHDKSIIKKIKSLNELNSINIDEINKYINNLKNVIDS